MPRITSSKKMSPLKRVRVTLKITADVPLEEFTYWDRNSELDKTPANAAEIVDEVLQESNDPVVEIIYDRDIFAIPKDLVWDIEVVDIPENE